MSGRVGEAGSGMDGAVAVSCGKTHGFHGFHLYQRDLYSDK